MYHEIKTGANNFRLKAHLQENFSQREEVLLVPQLRRRPVLGVKHK